MAILGGTVALPLVLGLLHLLPSAVLSPLLYGENQLLFLTLPLSFPIFCIGLIAVACAREYGRSRIFWACSMGLAYSAISFASAAMVYFKAMIAPPNVQLFLALYFFPIGNLSYVLPKP